MLARESFTELWQRIWYTCQVAWRYRNTLKAYQRNQNKQVAHVTDINCITLKNAGIQGCVIDFDGVLACHGDTQPLDVVQTWLKHCVEVFGPGKVFILTNLPTLTRLEFFQRHFPGIKMVDLIKRKPYPEGLGQILNQSQIAPAHLMMIDDRLLTGVLSAIIVGVPALWVTQPFISWRNRGITEAYIQGLRLFERLLF